MDLIIYYLNNGAWISISWLEGNTVQVVKSIAIAMEMSWNTKGFITKTATINSYNNEK
jgi:hypothetical protein